MPDRRIVEKARGLRRTMTLPEVKLWAVLRTRPDGIRYRRQHPIDHYVLDFYCPSARVAIEVDGIAHDMGDNPERDFARDVHLQARGIETMRFAATDVLNALEAVVAAITSRCTFPLHQPSAGPPPHAAHGEDVRADLP